MADDSLIAGLERAVEADPANTAIRRHLAELLLESGRSAAAIEHLHVLMSQHDDPLDRQLLTQALELERSSGPNRPNDPTRQTPAIPTDADAEIDDEERVRVPAHGHPDPELSDLAELFRPEISLDDIGGMTDVKERLRVSFLEPMRNVELREAFGKSLRSSLLLYGPPGCGKTLLAKALAGELGLYFISVELHDVLNMWVGNSEQNVARVFDEARRFAPSVLFLDELDALGHKRTGFTANATGRNVVNALLTEMDGVERSNEGLLVLGATNQPWDVDTALRRPGRFDRLMLVTPPDAEARTTILDQALQDRPTADDIDLGVIVDRTVHYSGADLAHLIDTATEQALSDSVQLGKVRPITQADLETALTQIGPSTLAWFNTVRSYATFANPDGTYDDLINYLGRHRLL